MRPTLHHFLSAGIAVVCFASGRCVAESAQPVTIARGQAQLFVDDSLIASQTNLKRTLHQPTKDNGSNIPIITLDKEFDGKPATLEANGSIIFDARLKKWVMYAVGFCQLEAGADRTRIYRYTSSDAMSWTKGDDGTPYHVKMDRFDPISGTSAMYADLFSCCYDPDDAEQSYKGWCWFANWGEHEGLYYVWSHDGRKWQRGLRVAPIGAWKFHQDGRTLVGPSDVSIFYRDPESKRFLGLLKFASATVVEPNNALRSRAYTFVDSLSAPIKPGSLDHVDLVPPAKAMNGDQPHDEYYASTAWRYESLWLGGLKVWHGGGDYPYSAAGSAFLKLSISHDGLHWRKVRFPNDSGVPEVFLANGPEGGNNGQNDGGYMTEFSQGPLRIGDELIYYYGSSSWGKNHSTPPRVTGGGIFRARLRLDGFISVDGGTLATPLLQFSGDNLYLNSAGPINVEVVNADGQVIGKTAVNGDSTHHLVTFKGHDLRQVAPNSVVSLRLTVADGGKLYSFKID